MKNFNNKKMKRITAASSTAAPTQKSKKNDNDNDWKTTYTYDYTFKNLKKDEPKKKEEAKCTCNCCNRECSKSQENKKTTSSKNAENKNNKKLEHPKTNSSGTAVPLVLRHEIMIQHPQPPQPHTVYHTYEPKTITYLVPSSSVATLRPEYSSSQIRYPVKINEYYGSNHSHDSPEVIEITYNHY